MDYQVWGEILELLKYLSTLNNKKKETTLADMLWNISWEDKARKAIAWGIAAGSDVLAGQ